MRKIFAKIRRAAVAVVLLSSVGLPAWAANTKTTVSQVTTAVTLTDDVDYIISSDKPFDTNGEIDIKNTEHAVVILSSIKPSKAISQWLKYIKIDGAKAVNNTNCMVKLYNLGCIILPYSGGDKFKPLTVFSEKNFEGESCNDFGLENSDGYMNTLTDEKLNNRISSFKLKRGYMVTFALKAGGSGYSRCFIAADKDLEMASLPGILDNSISSYRIFKWYDAGKKQLANDLNTTTLAALNVQSSYTWSEGKNMAPDYECVPNHIYEDYPSSRAIGRATWSPHTKNNNEPRNSADDHPQDLKTILNNWENMMRTGMRLCTPASWDGSDYVSNAGGFLAEFLDSIDARGWRCDIIDLHCYWAEGTFYSMHNWSDKYKRPIWISEWCWGASWNKNGAFASGVTKQQVKEALERICTSMNNWDYVERYYYWNGEASISRLYDGGLTPAGQYYASMNSGVGYNGKYDYAPKTPKQYNPSDLTVSFNKSTNVATLNWYEPNGEMNASMTVQRRPAAGKPWTDVARITLNDDPGTYSYEDAGATNGCQYRIYVVDANNKDRYTDIVMAASDDLEPGDAIDLSGTTKYIGGNIFVNGDFNMGCYGWTNGKGETPAAPYFQAVTAGGNDGKAYLQAYGNGALTTEQAINSSFDIKPNTDYYFSVSSSNMPTGYSNRLGLSEEGKIATAPKVYINNTTPNWVTQFDTFNSESYTQARLQLYNLGAKAQIDQLLLCQLFDTKEEALADGIEKDRLRAEAFKAFNTKFTYLNDDLTQILSSVTTTDAEAFTTVNTAVKEAIQAYELCLLLENGKLEYAKKVAALNLYGKEDLETVINYVEKARTAMTIVSGYDALQDAIEQYLPHTIINDKISQPNFVQDKGWTTKCGTYTNGDQRTATQDGVTCWNAWWSGIDATDESMSMAIKQEVTISGSQPTHGLYALECKASTEHYCLSDQHGYITDGTTKENTSTLTADYLDLNIPVSDRWETLVTAPIYVADNADITIGFEGTKRGSLNGAWLEVGNANSKNDKREGWWCATDFAFRFTPLYKATVVPEQCGVICLPYAARPAEDMKFYKIAGINSEYTQLCLEETEEAEAGIPCIYTSANADAMFYEYGESVTKTTDGAGNLRGFLLTAARVPANYYYIKDGGFEKMTSSERPSIGNFTGIMRPFTDKSSNPIPVIDNWEGKTMPISGVTDEEKEHNNISGISTIAKTSSQPDGIYSIDGRNVTTATSLKHGIYIKVINGQAYKTVIR